MSGKLSKTQLAAIFAQKAPGVRVKSGNIVIERIGTDRYVVRERGSLTGKIASGEDVERTATIIRNERKRKETSQPLFSVRNQ